ncbi:MAG TPA: hypothetical protein VGQ94_02600, partial [Terriglobales bacterium]|nr:hypothetical protein [Terriglobales bacterium]
GVQMVVAAMHAHTGLVSQSALNLVKMASYNCAVLVWLGYFLMPEPARRPIPEPEAPQVEGWNQVLSQLLQR